MPRFIYSQWVPEKRKQSATPGAIGHAGTVGGRARLQVPLKRPGLKREFLSCQDLGLQVHQGQVAGTHGQIFEIDAGEMHGCYPGLRKIRKVK